MVEFLRHYVKKFANKSLSTAEWKATLDEFFAAEIKEGKLDGLDFDRWFNDEGMTPTQPVLV